MKSEKEIREIADDMITAYGHQAVITATQRCDRAAQAGNIDKAALWRRISIVIGDLQRDRPPDTRPTCLICHLPIDLVQAHENGDVEQFCKDCGGFKVDAALHAKWAADPARYEQIRLNTILYVEEHNEEGETPLLTEIVMARLKNWQ